MSFKEFFNGKTYSNEQRANFPGDYNGTVAAARRVMLGTCAAGALAAAYVFAGAIVFNPHNETTPPQTDPSTISFQP